MDHVKKSKNKESSTQHSRHSEPVETKPQPRDSDLDMEEFELVEEIDTEEESDKNEESEETSVDLSLEV